MKLTWKLLPHEHHVYSNESIIQVKDPDIESSTPKKHSHPAKLDSDVASWSEHSTSTNHGILIQPDIPIGRLELVSSCIQSCRIINSCDVCHELKFAARFLSKEMMVFTHEQENQSENELTMIVNKCAKLIRINNTKVEEANPCMIHHGSVLSILLPTNAHSQTLWECNIQQENKILVEKNSGPLVLQFTFIAIQNISDGNEVNVQSRQSTNLSSARGALNQNPENSLFIEHGECDNKNIYEESPDLSLPCVEDISKNLQNNSFESHLSAGLLTMEESEWNLS